ncbi:MAG: ribosome biogenesis GTP-binding protein YihA/YsxC [Lachnospiraceae bacterium]|nr:ribosome biogenesis GTP-binding protein YihA/YsxC [Lachnospiraceae bacterium]
MIIKDVQLETVCGITSTFPDNQYMEIAFAGKSNVGKSSLINGLLNRKNLAHTSSQPGKTQTVNFYRVSCYHENQEQKIAGNLYFVDLPGYGYANARMEIRAQWGEMIEKYLHTSRMLASVFLLVDIRHEPSANDRLMYFWICDQGFSPVIIATKADKINRSQLDKHKKMLRTGLQLEKGTEIFPYSALTKQGRDEIYAYIDGLAFQSGIR